VITYVTLRRRANQWLNSPVHAAQIALFLSAKACA